MNEIMQQISTFGLQVSTLESQIDSLVNEPLPKQVLTEAPGTIALSVSLMFAKRTSVAFKTRIVSTIVATISMINAT